MVLVCVYLLIQALTRFRHPLRGALIVIVVAFLYYAIVPGWVHARVAVGPNIWVQATPGYAFCLFLRQWPGAPDPGRSAAMP